MRALGFASAFVLAMLLAGQASLSAQVQALAPAVPDTPAGRQLAGYIAAVNSADPARLDAFLSTEYPTSPIPVQPGSSALFQDLTGGFDLVRMESANDGQVVALLGERAWEGYFLRLTMNVEPQPGGKITQLFIQPVPAPEGSPPIARMSETEALAALRAKLDDATKAGGDFAFSGAVRVTRHGRPVFEYVSGQADRAQGIANTLDTKFRIGSVNKSFTAVAILQLVEAGRIALDAPIGTYLPNYPNKDAAAKVTVRHLLTHTGGTGDIFGPEFFAQRTTLCEIGDYIALFGARDLTFAPSERYAYSNYGYMLLGAIVEAVSGQGYYDYVREHIYGPAGMTASGSEPESVEVHGRSIGYTNRVPGSNGQMQPNTSTLPCRGSPAGGGYSTVGDLTRFAEALRTGKLLGPDLLQAATTRQVPGGLGSNYGFGFVESEVNGTRAFWNNGGAPGMSAELMVFPELGYEVAVVANMDTQLASRFTKFIGERLPREGGGG
jgi:D-alanyl-D-alanine carboxypeptidase